MQMDQSEIRWRYKQARDRKEIITILAQLNNSSPEQIKEIVSDIIIQVAPKQKESKRISSVIDIEKLKELHAQGYDDKEISLRLNTFHSTVNRERNKLGLKVNHVNGGKMWKLEGG